MEPTQQQPRPRKRTLAEITAAAAAGTPSTGTTNAPRNGGGAGAEVVRPLPPPTLGMTVPTGGTGGTTGGGGIPSSRRRSLPRKKKFAAAAAAAEAAAAEREAAVAAAAAAGGVNGTADSTIASSAVVPSPSQPPQHPHLPQTQAEATTLVSPAAKTAKQECHQREGQMQKREALPPSTTAAAADDADPFPAPQDPKSPALQPKHHPPPSPPPTKAKKRKKKMSIISKGGSSSGGGGGGGGGKSGSSKKKKRHSPFRVKVGCVVAVRYRSGGGGGGGGTMTMDPNNKSSSRVRVIPPPGIMRHAKLKGSTDNNGGDDSVREGENGTSCTKTTAPSSPPSSTEAAVAIKAEAGQADKDGTGDEAKTKTVEARKKGVGGGTGTTTKKRPRPSSWTDHVEVWTDPIPGRDDGWALVGKRVRCIFPKSAVKKSAAAKSSPGDDKQGNNRGERQQQNKQPNRILEGEVVSILEGRATGKGGGRGGGHGTIVSLLIDRHAAANSSSFDFLPPDPVATGDPPDIPGIPDVERRRRRFEEIIRGGKDKVAVRVTLADLGCSMGEKRVAGAAAGAAGASNGGAEEGPIARWVVRKRVPVPAAGSGGKGPKTKSSNKANKAASSSAVWYVGDGNDAPPRQQQNWRWLAGQFDSLRQSDHCSMMMPGSKTGADTGPPLTADDRDSILVGEVTRVVASDSSSSSSATTTLATVTLRKLWLPEHTSWGRMAHHGPMELFGDDAPSSIQKASPPSLSSSSSSSDNHYLYQVPVEDLIVIGRHLERSSSGSATIGGGHFTARHSYSPESNVFIPLGIVENGAKASGSEGGPGAPLQTCHRCHRKMEATHMKQCCSSDCCTINGNKSHSVRLQDSASAGAWWCGQCCQILSEARAFSDREEGPWVGPCCAGICDCPTCSLQRRGGDLDCSLEDVVKASAEMLHRTEASRVTKTRSSELNNVCSNCLCPCTGSFVKCKLCFRKTHLECASWEKYLGAKMSPGSLLPANGAKEGPNGHGVDHNIETTAASLDGKKKGLHREANEVKVTCRCCRAERKRRRSGEATNLNVGLVGVLRSTIVSANPLHFELPADFLESLPTPSSDLITKVPTAKKSKKRKRAGEEKSPVKKPTSPRPTSPRARKKIPSPVPTTNGAMKSKGVSSSQPGRESEDQKKDDDDDDDQVFRPTCSRTVQYDPSKKAFAASQVSNVLESSTRIHVSRRGDDSAEKGSKPEEKKSSSRAARANQRRMLKDVASFGAVGFGLDTLAGREQALRFGRSGIHAWGVFADEEINAEDMIVEYRGVLIENTVAEKREKEYEKAKIGSDYMFRIDDDIVCDATHQGNVARFINASCNPNCYTKIVTINGSKRIVIYAKQDIRPGEELVYDYKFPIEYDEKKRIPCHCGAPNCRGFMNWDKRYVAIPPKDIAEKKT